MEQGEHKLSGRTYTGECAKMNEENFDTSYEPGYE
jgi:hypothetical protein